MEEQVIAERVRTAREWRGWSQTELARRAEIHPVVLNRLEMKHKAGVQAETIRRLALALQVSADYLLGISKTLERWHETETPRDTTPTPQAPAKRPRTRKAAPVG
jgi:transcriptional regulator with XRE-family HTH domain